MDYNETELRFDTFLQAFMSLFDVSFPRHHLYTPSRLFFWHILMFISVSIQYYSYLQARIGQ
jgi:hypothetical protein